MPDFPGQVSPSNFADENSPASGLNSPSNFEENITPSSGLNSPSNFEEVTIVVPRGFTTQPWNLYTYFYPRQN